MTGPSLDDVFAQAGGGSGAPSYAWPKDGKAPKIGHVVSGEITDLFLTVVKDADTGDPKLDKNGRTQPQVNVTLQTTLRNWEGVINVPKDEQGNTLPASEDTGLRRIYVKHRMLDAVARAIKESEQKSGGPKVGARLAVKVKGALNTGKLNPLPDYDARYEPPSGVDEAFRQATESTPRTPTAQGKDPAEATDTWGDDPPF